MFALLECSNRVALAQSISASYERFGQGRSGPGSRRVALGDSAAAIVGARIGITIIGGRRLVQADRDRIFLRHERLLHRENHLRRNIQK